jgi:transposase
MRIIGCDLHAAQQTIAMLDGDTGEVVERTLTHDGESVREFLCVDLPTSGGRHRSDRIDGVVSPVTGGVGDPVPGGASGRRSEGETRRQKHDRRDADLLLKLLVEDRFPAIWMPSTEQRDLRALLLHRHQWVRMRTRVQQASRPWP